MNARLIKNALSRSLGVELNEECVDFMSVTSRGSTGHATRREDVHHLFIEFESLPAHWFESLRHELRKEESQEIGLSKFGDDVNGDGNEIYAQLCRNLNPEKVTTGTAAIKFYYVQIRISENFNVKIILRDKFRNAEQ